jgi:hypothetical protein
MSEAMFTIANKYALVKEATLETREQKKEKELGHTDHPSSSKGHGKKRKVDHSVNAVERPWCNKEYRPKPGDFEGFLDHICIFIPRKSTRPETMTDSKILHMRCSRQPKGLIKRNSTKNPRVTSLNLIRTLTTSMVTLTHMSQGGSKNSAREVMAVSPATLEYLKWSKVPITFNHSDHLDFVPKPRQYPLIVRPIVKDVKLNRVLVDGGSSLNILFLKTFNQMGLSRSLLCPSQAPFHGIVPGAAATPVGQITLPVTFGTWDNIRMENL